MKDCGDAVRAWDEFDVNPRLDLRQILSKKSVNANDKGGDRHRDAGHFGHGRTPFLCTSCPSRNVWG